MSESVISNIVDQKAGSITTLLIVVNDVIPANSSAEICGHVTRIGSSSDGRIPLDNEAVTTDLRQSCSTVAFVDFRAAARDTRRPFHSTEHELYSNCILVVLIISGQRILTKDRIAGVAEFSREEGRGGAMLCDADQSAALQSAAAVAL